MDRVCKESRGKGCYRMWTWGPQAPSSSSLGLLSLSLTTHILLVQSLLGFRSGPRPS